MQYPLAEDTDSSPFTHTRDAHEAFLKSRSDTVIGRTDVLQKVNRVVIVMFFTLGRHTDRHTDARDNNTFCIVYDSHEM